MFWGESGFKTPMPPNVLDRGFSAYIKSKQEILFTDQEVDQIYEAIQSGRLPKGWKTKREHLNSIKERLSSKTICPKCGSSLKLRKARKGRNAGHQFYGCSSYPACKYTTNI
jgi:restriction system protein